MDSSACGSCACSSPCCVLCGGGRVWVVSLRLVPLERNDWVKDWELSVADWWRFGYKLYVQFVVFDCQVVWGQLSAWGPWGVAVFCLRCLLFISFGQVDLTAPADVIKVSREQARCARLSNSIETVPKNSTHSGGRQQKGAGVAQAIPGERGDKLFGKKRPLSSLTSFQVLVILL